MITVIFYINDCIISISSPDMEPRKYSSTIINIFSLIFLLSLNSTNMAVPLPVSRPLINELKLIALFKYNSVSITLEPQVGINPIKLVINGPNSVFFRNIFDSKSSPKYVNSMLIIRIVIRR